MEYCDSPRKLGRKVLARALQGVAGEARYRALCGMRLRPKDKNHSCPCQGRVNPAEPPRVCEGKETKYTHAEDRSQELSLKLMSVIILTKA